MESAFTFTDARMLREAAVTIRVHGTEFRNYNIVFGQERHCFNKMKI